MPPWSPESLLSQASSRASSITRTLTFCNPRQRIISISQRRISLSPPLPGLVCRGRMPRFPPPQLRSFGTAAFQPQLPSQTSQWERTDQSRPKNPPDGTAVSRLKASIPRPPRANRTATTSLCSVLRPKGGATGKASPDGSHPARPKQKQTVCPHPDKPQAFVGSDAPRQAAKL